MALSFISAKADSLLSRSFKCFSCSLERIPKYKDNSFNSLVDSGKVFILSDIFFNA